MVNLNIAIQFLDPTESQATCTRLTAMHLYFQDLEAALEKAIEENKKVKDCLDNDIQWLTIKDFGFESIGDFAKQVSVFLESDDGIVYQMMRVFARHNWDAMSGMELGEFVKKVDAVDEKLLFIVDIINQCLPKQEFVDPNGKKIGELDKISKQS